MSDKPYDELPESVADQLLARLSTDDTFRTLFSSDPRAALAELGFDLASDASVQRGIWESLKVNQLADKQAIAGALASFRADVLSARAAADPISLDQARG